MNNNPMMQLFQMIRNGQNPQNYIVQMLKQNGQNNPMIGNLTSMIEKNDTAGIETFARNLAQSQGKDFDKEFASFKKQLGL